MAIVQEFDLNMIPDSEPVVVHVDQYDKGTGRFLIHLYNGTVAYTPANGATAIIQGTKADNKGYSYNATISGSSVTANLEEQMTAAAGRSRVSIVITEGNNRTGTFVFWLDVQPSSLASDIDISETVIPAYIDAAQRSAEAAATSAAAAAASAASVGDEAKTAEAYAKGTRNGTPVGSSDPAYHNNSKYYSEQSSTGATNSSNSALTSEAYATGKRNGSDVGSSDPAYHNNSKYFSEQASTSATNAGTSATNAAGSASDAEAYGIGTRGGTPVESTDPAYHKNSKYYSELASTWSEHPPYIGANGNWYIYNTTTGQFVDSGIDASITVQIADVTMLLPDATPYVTNTGTATDPIFHLFLPKGDKGDKGDTGPSGPGTGDMLRSVYDPNDNRYQLNEMTGATASEAGTVGFPPAPAAGDNEKFLRGDGTWAQADSLGTLVTGTVSGKNLSFTDASISGGVIDGPYIADVPELIVSTTINGTTVSYVLSDSNANGKTAYIWVRTIST